MKILVVGAHPDDAVLCCGGTIKKYVDRGDKVVVCTVSDGCFGSVEIPPKELEKIRPVEDENAVKHLGAEYINLGISDQYVHSNSFRQIDKLIGVIREVKPDLIITHAPDDYHRDHQETYKLAFRASCAASLHFFNNSEKEPIEHPICPIYLMDSFALKNFEPTEYVDVSDTLNFKKEAIVMYETQYDWMKEHDNLDLRQYVEDCGAVRGYQCGVARAEGFRMDNNYGRMTTKRLLP